MSRWMSPGWGPRGSPLRAWGGAGKPEPGRRGRLPPGPSGSQKCARRYTGGARSARSGTPLGTKRVLRRAPGSPETPGGAVGPRAADLPLRARSAHRWRGSAFTALGRSCARGTPLVHRFRAFRRASVIVPEAAAGVSGPFPCSQGPFRPSQRCTGPSTSLWVPGGTPAVPSAWALAAQFPVGAYQPVGRSSGHGEAQDADRARRLHGSRHPRGRSLALRQPHRPRCGPPRTAAGPRR